MALKTFVKVSNVTNLSDARYCAGMGVNQIGFCINPSSNNYVSFEIIKEITGWISGIDIVSELEDSKEKVLTDIVEINTLENELFNDKKVILKLSIDDAENQISQLKGIKNLEYIIVTSEGEIDNYMISRINNLSTFIPTVIGFGVTQENVNQIIESGNIKGIALSGGHEIRPGFKDYDELADILEAIEIE